MRVRPRIRARIITTRFIAGYRTIHTTRRVNASVDDARTKVKGIGRHGCDGLPLSANRVKPIDRSNWRPPACVRHTANVIDITVQSVSRSRTTGGWQLAAEGLPTRGRSPLHENERMNREKSREPKQTFPFLNLLRCQTQPVAQWRDRTTLPAKPWRNWSQPASQL